MYCLPDNTALFVFVTNKHYALTTSKKMSTMGAADRLDVTPTSTGLSEDTFPFSQRRCCPFFTLCRLKGFALTMNASCTGGILDDDKQTELSHKPS